jgi:D-glycerate 3-kinase
MLAEPINALEAEEDADGLWRGHANAALAGAYAALFDRVDVLAMLAAPNFEVVPIWRAQQEAPLQRRGQGMAQAALARFIAHYERLTRHMLGDMPQRADLLLRLDGDRAVREIRRNLHRHR